MEVLESLADAAECPGVHHGERQGQSRRIASAVRRRRRHQRRRSPHAKWCSRRTSSSSLAAAPVRPRPSTGRYPAATFRSCTSTSTHDHLRQLPHRRCARRRCASGARGAARRRVSHAAKARTHKAVMAAPVVARARKAKFDAFHTGSEPATADHARARRRRAASRAARATRSSSPIRARRARTCRGYLRRRAGPSLHYQSRARRARLFDVRGGWRAGSGGRHEMRLAHGRWQLRLFVRRARDRCAPKCR